ncbi:MAG TPA: alpha/beta hydrolase [Brevefilum fermentans]|jgi:pimeloyl-ACP methyl ester carboxylesterase|nr:alpha/beta hydrolase [Brevefilum fermentans]
MSKRNTIYQTPMEPWPALARYGQQIELKKPALRLFFFDTGQVNKPVLMMIHGLGDEADTWRHVYAPLSDNFRVIALDLPGFGRSDKLDVDYTPNYFLSAIVGLMNQLAIPDATLMGSSLGGILAHQIALSHPERINGLVLVGGSIFQPQTMQDWSLRLMSLPAVGKWLYTRLRNDPDAAYASLNNVYHQIEALSQEDRSFLYYRVNQRVWDDGQRRAYLSTLRNLAPWIKHLQADLPAKLKNLQHPTLVIRGEFDLLFSEANSDAIVNIQPNARKAIIQGAGHLPHQEAPGAFLSLIQKWFSEKF